MKYNLSNIICMRKNKTIYRDNEYSIKLFEDNIPTSKVLNEALNQQRVIENTDINIPKLIEVAKIDDKWAIVSEYIEGVTLEQYLETHEDSLDDVLEIFVNTQLQIQKCKVPLLTRTKEKFSDKLKETTLIDNNTKFELLQRLEGMKNHTKLCHGDLSLSNVVVKNDGTVYVLDWAHATQGNASADVARTYLTMSLKGKNELANAYITKYSIKSGISKSHIQRWIPIVAATQLTKNNESDKNLLPEWIDVVDYE